MPWALIDPNWNEGEIVVLETVAANRDEAVRLAETDEGVALWSGHSPYPLPSGTKGNIKNLERHGYRIAEIDISIKPSEQEGE